MYTYLITGATSDVGMALIKSLPRNSKFILAGHGDGESLKKLCENIGCEYIYFDADFTDISAIDLFVEKISACGWDPTHFIHLPALSVINTKFKNFDEERFLADINVQLLTAIKICKWLLPKMAKAKFGRVLFMSTSYVLANPPKNTAAYIIAKSGIVGLMKSLATDYASNGITVNCVSPSMIETKFLAQTSHIIVESAAARHPLKRNATVDDVIPAMVFLLSEESRFITGVNLPVTGGSIIE